MNEAIRLKPWEEACGMLQSVVEEFPYLTLDFGKFRVVLGSDEASNIKSRLTGELIGKRISVLRTDIPDKPALMRVI
ncbi:MAG: hypothetical protein METHAR1v1_1400005 [Methanothrix sp.]|jgi:hypothetical protein|nr:MAG: hypothetical protein METHAR1v1_1400005 [Methanothrix sp.]